MDIVNDCGVKRYVITSGNDTNLLIGTLGTCTDTEDSKITLQEATHLGLGNPSSNSLFLFDDVRYMDHYIPQWYNDWKDGKSAPSEALEEPIEKEANVEKEASGVADGWYNLTFLDNYINIDTNSKAELRNKPTNEAFYVENKKDGRITLKMANGMYLGLVSTAIKNGVQLNVSTNSLQWAAYSENKDGVYSLRPSSDRKMVLNASDEKSADGTVVLVWTHENLDAPLHGELRFIPTAVPTVAPTGTPSSKHPFTDVAASSYYENPVI